MAEKKSRKTTKVTAQVPDTERDVQTTEHAEEKPAETAEAPLSGKETYAGEVNTRTFTEEEHGKEAMETLRKAKCREVIRLHLELVPTYNNGDELSREDDAHYEEDVITELHRYGGVKYGDHISRDVLVPGDMQLWALHYMIQRSFGWQNSHQHRFYLPSDRFEEITGGKAGSWANLAGLIFRSPLMDESDLYWSEDYSGGAFTTWLRKKYTGPYRSGAEGEEYDMVHAQLREYQDYSGTPDPGVFGRQSAKDGRKRNEKYVLEWATYGNGDDAVTFLQKTYPEKQQKEMAKRQEELDAQDPDNPYTGSRFVTKKEVLPWKDLPVYALGTMFEGSVEDLLERMEVQDVLCAGERGLIEDGYAPDPRTDSPADYGEMMTAAEKAVAEMKDRSMVSPHIRGITKKLYYAYDFGDGWTVKVTGSLGCADLVKSGRVTQKELDDANIQVRKSYRPVMIARDGENVVDDMGGYDAIPCFLRAINGDFSKDNEMYEDREDTIEWAESQGWSRRKVALKSRL